MIKTIRPHLPLMIAVALTTACAVAAMNSQNNLLFWTMGMIAASVVVSLILSYLSLRALSVRRLDPNHGVVGEPLIIQYEIRNKSRFLPVFNLHIEELQNKGHSNWRRFMLPARGWVMHISPGETVHGEIVFWPRARGEMKFHSLRYKTTFPFGLVQRQKKIAQPAHTLIFPKLYSLKRGVLKAIVPSGPLGLKLSGRPGGGDDYFGMREYKPGDSRRQIAWKRSAGSNELIIKERTLPSPPRIRIVLNLKVETDSIKGEFSEELTPRHLEERAISLAATMVDGAVAAGYEVGLTVLGADIPVTPLRHSYWHVEKIMGALASINLDEPRTPPVELLVMDSERAGLVVVHPGRVDPTLRLGECWHFSALQLEYLVAGRDQDTIKLPETENASTKPGEINETETAA